MSDPEQLGLLFPAASQRRVWTVRDLVGAVRTAVERHYTDIFVEGEISNLRLAESGHIYFTLKDGDAQLSIVMFRSQARLLRFRPDNGMQVIARGRVTIYEARGSLQLSAEYLEPKGAGALQVAFEQLKARLAAEGLFDASRKRPLPAMPKRIGVITSPRGAAIQDILNVLRRRHESVHVSLYPAQVQGESAPSEVTSGLKYFNSRKPGDLVDVIIIARGGGSVEDLAAFNDEGLARAIVASKIPTISAVGHETDFTIADFVADLRAPTPSAAAELVIESKHQIADRSESLRRRLERALDYRLLISRNRLTELARHGAFAGIRDLLNRRQQRVDDLRQRLRESHRGTLREYRRRLEVARVRLSSRDLRTVLAGRRREWESLNRRMESSIRSDLRSRRGRAELLAGRLEALSPVSILDRGYALVFDSNGRLIKDPAQVRPGDDITARVAGGTIAAQVKPTRS